MQTMTEVRYRSLVAALLFIALAGCSSSGPTLSGLAFGENRVVRVGDTVTLRIPIREDGLRQWRVSSYDSLYLQMSGRPGVEQASDGSYQIVARATARRVGTTTIELTEEATGGKKPRVARFKVRVIE